MELRLLRLLSLWGWAACFLQIQTCIHPTGGGPCKSWRYWKYVEEPAYGPGPAVHTIVFIIEILRNDASFSGRFQSHSLKSIRANKSISQRCTVCDPAEIYFSHSKLGYLLFSNPTLKTNTGTANIGGRNF